MQQSEGGQTHSNGGFPGQDCVLGPQSSHCQRPAWAVPLNTRDMPGTAAGSYLHHVSSYTTLGPLTRHKTACCYGSSRLPDKRKRHKHSPESLSQLSGRSMGGGFSVRGREPSFCAEQAEGALPCQPANARLNRPPCAVTGFLRAMPKADCPQSPPNTPEEA